MSMQIAFFYKIEYYNTELFQVEEQKWVEYFLENGP